MDLDKLAVVGLGYVGIPVAARFADEGMRVVGIDVDQGKVDDEGGSATGLGAHEDTPPVAFDDAVGDRADRQSGDR